MVDRIESRRVLVPATFGAGSLTFTDLDFPPGIVRSVAIVVPRGVQASIGVGLGYGGSVVIPNTSGELVYTDGEILECPVDGLPVGVQWQLVTDPQAATDHLITVRMAVDEIAERPGQSQAPSPAEQVMALAPAEPLAVPDDTTPADLPADATGPDADLDTSPTPPPDLPLDDTGTP